MEDKDQTIKKAQPSDAWKLILANIFTLGVMIGAYECIFHSSLLCYSSFFSYSALHFAILSSGFAFFSLAQSFIPQAIAAVAKIYPDASGKAKWHARSIFRLRALSDIGYTLVMLACGWMFPYGGSEVWHMFPVMFGIGLAIIVYCQVINWIKHKPYRDITVQAYAIKAILFILLMFAMVIYWAYRPFYFDPIAVILLYSLCSVAADLLVSIRHQIAFKRSNSVLG